MNRTRWLPWLLICFAAGCAAVPSGAPDPTAGLEKPAPAELPSPVAGEVESSAPRADHGGERAPQPVRPTPSATPRREDIRQRYEQLLELPGTSEERKPEILLRLAELAYRGEEAALRAAYERGDEPDLPPGARYVNSISYYEQLAERYPDSPQALTSYYNLGYLYAEEGDIYASVRAYGAALERDPGTQYADEIHMRLGEAAFDAGTVEIAIPHYRAVVAGGKPEYVDKALYKLGWCYFNLEDYQRAVEAFAQVLERGEASPENLRRETLDVMARSFQEWGGAESLGNYLAKSPSASRYGDRLYRLLGDRYVEASRYREAVRAYTTGVEAYPTASECLRMERGVLQALLTVRDLEAANRRREGWARRYAPDSPWGTAHAENPLAAERDAMVEEGLRLAALYHHGRAQRGQGSLEHALELYASYLEWFGAVDERGYEMAYSFAQGLKEAGKLRAAADRYRAVAEHASHDTHRETSSYRRLEVLLIHGEDPAVLEELLAAHDMYVELNPESPVVPEVLFAKGEIQFEIESFTAARESFGQVHRRFRDHSLATLALERSARCHFREENYPEAEQAARTALERGLEPQAASRLRELIAFSIFKQAERSQAEGEMEGANGHFFRLAEEFPAADAAQIALYRAAQNLRTLGQEGEAAKVFEGLARKYRGSEYAQSALTVSAQIHASLGNWQEAARNYERFYRTFPGDPTASDALFRAARAFETAADLDRAERLFGEFAVRFPEDPRRAQTRFLQGEILRRLGREGGALASYRAAWQADDSEEADPYRAMAALKIGTLKLEEFRAIELRGDLAAALIRKEELLAGALEDLVRTASLPYAETFTEALFLAGTAFEQMKDAILNSERPPGLDQEEQEEYEFLLEEKAFPLEERAVGYFRKAVAAARDAGVYTSWVGHSYSRLEELVPWAYRRAEQVASAWDLPALPATGAP